MPKKRRRDRDRHEYREAMRDPALPPDQPDQPPLEYVQPTPEEQKEIDTWAEPAPGPGTKPSLPITEVLDAIRSNASEMRRHHADTIAELEAWRAEIDAAIAFLKAKA